MSAILADQCQCWNDTGWVKAQIFSFMLFPVSEVEVVALPFDLFCFEDEADLLGAC